MWDLKYRSTTAKGSDGKVRFHVFPDGMKNEVKEYIAFGILGEDLSNSWVHGTVAALKKASQLFVAIHGVDFSPLQLVQNDARLLEEHFRQMGLTCSRRDIAIVARFAEFLRDKYNGQPSDFRPNPLAAPPRRDKRRSYSEGLERVIPDEVSTALMEAIGRHQTLLREKSSRSNSQQLRSDFLYTVVLALLLYSGRRISEILLLKRNCLREPIPDEIPKTGKGIWLTYRNTKATLGEKEAFIGEPGDDLVREMVAYVQMLTEPLAKASGLDKLFLTDSIKKNASRDNPIRPIRTNAFYSWLNGFMTDDDVVQRPGFVHKYNIKYCGKYYQFDPHQARHTLAHKAYLGGASYVDVGDHLHHKRSHAGLSPMTGVYLHGHKKDVQLIQEMNANQAVMGKAAPLIDNRLVVLNDLDPSDLTIFNEQGIVLLPTHYGHCILPAVSGPCVCGDPCWIGPRGNGCDYALYTPESKNALLADRALLESQIEALEQSHPKDPRLGQWKVRLDRLDQVLKEIADAEWRKANGLITVRPRAQTIPRDPPLQAAQPRIPAQNSIRQRRREAARKSRGVPKHPEPLAQNLDAETLQRAEALLQKLESRNVPMEPSAFTRRLGVSVGKIYQHADIYDRLSQHNARCAATFEKIIETRLEEIRKQGRTVSHEEFAQLCGVSRTTLFRLYGDWSKILTEHNRIMRIAHGRDLAERHLQELQRAGLGQPVREFAKQIGIGVATFRADYKDMVQLLIEHNKKVGLQLVTRNEQDIPRHTEAFLAAAFAEIERSNRQATVLELAAQAGVQWGVVAECYPHWRDRLQEHNRRLMTERLQAAWEQMEQSGETWICRRLAEEAGISLATLQRSYSEWIERLKARTPPTIERVLAALEKAKSSSKLMSSNEFAREAGISRALLHRTYIEQYLALIEHNRTAFRPRVEACWDMICETNAYPTLAEFAELCDFQNASVLQFYFPDAAERIRGRLRSKE